MIVVTGAAGFVGRNFVKYLNKKGHKNILLVDSLSKKNYFRNLIGLEYVDFLNFEKGIDYLENSIKNRDIKAIFHIGANADVLIEDCNVMMDMNFEHSKFWFNLAKKRKIPFIYASSSAVYGNSNCFNVELECEKPHNEYAFSKLAFDNYVRGELSKNCSNKIVGYRFFNIFGLGEFHKNKNASLPYRFFDFMMDKEKGYIDIFDKKIKRDYVWVEDVCKILYKTWKENIIKSGIYNLGSGNPQSHEKIANLVLDAMIEEKIIDKENKEQYIKKINMPEILESKFQFFTKAENLLEWISDITKNNDLKIKNYIKELIKGCKYDNKKQSPA